MLRSSSDRASQRTPLGLPVVPEVKMIAATASPKEPSCTVAEWKTLLRTRPGKTLGSVVYKAA